MPTSKTTKTAWRVLDSAGTDNRSGSPSGATPPPPRGPLRAVDDPDVVRGALRAAVLLGVVLVAVWAALAVTIWWLLF